MTVNKLVLKMLDRKYGNAYEFLLDLLPDCLSIDSKKRIIVFEYIDMFTDYSTENKKKSKEIIRNMINTMPSELIEHFGYSIPMVNWNLLCKGSIYEFLKEFYAIGLNELKIANPTTIHDFDGARMRQEEKVKYIFADSFITMLEMESRAMIREELKRYTTLNDIIKEVMKYAEARTKYKIYEAKDYGVTKEKEKETERKVIVDYAFKGKSNSDTEISIIIEPTESEWGYSLDINESSDLVQFMVGWVNKMPIIGVLKHNLVNFLDRVRCVRYDVFYAWLIEILHIHISGKYFSHILPNGMGENDVFYEKLQHVDFSKETNVTLCDKNVTPCDKCDKPVYNIKIKESNLTFWVDNDRNAYATFFDFFDIGEDTIVFSLTAETEIRIPIWKMEGFSQN